VTIAGAGESGYVRSIEETISHFELTKHIKLIGHVSPERKAELFEQADITVIPSHTENFAQVVAEALAHGVPVIASRGTPWRRVEQVGCGFWVNNDPDTLATMLEKMSTMPLSDMGSAGREWMKREFSWEAVAASMADLYRRLMREAGE
jgi:glycosyltransferase involved in cell wall biosynthesis